LLLFISLLNFQNIPRDLLKKYKSDVSVDNFIYYLKKYSLITNDYLDSDPSYSIHKSTQNISFAYLNESLKLSKDSKLLKKIVYILDDYLDEIIELENYSRMQIVAGHIEQFLNHGNLLTDFSTGLLKSKLGCIYYFINDDKSKKMMEDSLRILKTESLENTSSSDNLRIARSLLHIGAIYTELRLDKEAEEALEKARSIYEKKGSKNYVDLSWALSHLGNLQRKLGNYEKARDYFEESIRLHKYCEITNKRTAQTLAYLGSVYKGLGSYQKSVDILKKSLVFYQKNNCNNHFRVGWILVQLGSVFSKLGDPQKAKEYLEKGLLIFQKHLPDNHVSMRLAYAYLGSCYRELGDYNKSRDYLEKSLKIYQKHFDENHVKMGWILFHLASTYKIIGQHQEAQRLFDKVLKIYANHCGEDNIEKARLLGNMAKICLEKNLLEDAENFIIKSLKIFQSHHHIEAYTSLMTLGEILLKKSNHPSYTKNNQESQNLKDQAIDKFNQALKITEQYFPKDSIHIQKIHTRIKSIQK
jgi:tetratricopeptide (TPR) repeat protein